jgi:hypothetical protein
VLILKNNLTGSSLCTFMKKILCFSPGISCIADWRFREFYPCRNCHLAMGVTDESRAKQQRHFSALYE